MLRTSRAFLKSACVFLLGRFCGFLRIIAGYRLGIRKETLTFPNPVAT